MLKSWSSSLLLLFCTAIEILQLSFLPSFDNCLWSTTKFLGSWLCKGKTDKLSFYFDCLVLLFLLPRTGSLNVCLYLLWFMKISPSLCFFNVYGLLHYMLLIYGLSSLCRLFCVTRTEMWESLFVVVDGKLDGWS